jgi:hypothetical protein
MENKMKNVPIVRGQSSSSVADVNDGNDDTDDGNDANNSSSDFVTSSNFVTTTPLNVVSTTTTQSFVPPQIELSLPPHTFSPSISSEDSSYSSLEQKFFFCFYM